MTEKSKFPDLLFLPPEAFNGYSKYLNIYGKDHVIEGDGFVEYVRKDVQQAEIYVPGVWRCAKCNLRMVITTMSAVSGAMTPSQEPCKCQNCDMPMWRWSWKDEAKATAKMLRAMAQAYSPTNTDKEKAKADKTIIATVNHFHNLAYLYQAKTGGTA